MGKRIIRVPATAEALAQLNGIQLNVVLRNGVTYFGRLVSQQNQELILEDGLLRQHRYPLEQIAEIIYDLKAAF